MDGSLGSFASLGNGKKGAKVSLHFKKRGLTEPYNAVQSRGTETSNQNNPSNLQVAVSLKGHKSTLANTLKAEITANQSHFHSARRDGLGGWARSTRDKALVFVINFRKSLPLSLTIFHRQPRKARVGGLWFVHSWEGTFQNSCSWLPCAGGRRFEAQFYRELNTFSNLSKASINIARAGGAANTSEKLSDPGKLRKLQKINGR